MPAFDPNAFDGGAFDAASSVVTLAGSSSGISTTSSVLHLTRSLNGTSNGVATVTSVLSRHVGLVASSSGAASSGASLTRTVGLVGSSSGIATVIGVLKSGMTGTSAGVATVSASLSVTRALAGSSAGASASSAVLTNRVLLAGTSSGSGTSVATAMITRKLAGTSAGVAATSASLLVVDFLHGTSSGTGSTSAVASVSRGLVGSSAGSSTTTSTLSASVTALLHGISAGQSSATGKLSGGSLSASVGISAPVSSSLTVSTTPATAGDLVVDVDDASVLSVGQTVIIDGFEYEIAAIGTGTITLGTPLVTNVPSGSPVAGVVSVPLNAGGYRVAHRTLLDLEAMAARQPVLVPMQARYPVYNRTQPIERQIAFEVYFIARTYQQRRSDYEALVSSLDSLSGLVTLKWTGTDGIAREYYVTVLDISPDGWFNRATATLIAPSPYSVQVA